MAPGHCGPGRTTQAPVCGRSSGSRLDRPVGSQRRRVRGARGRSGRDRRQPAAGPACQRRSLWAGPPGSLHLERERPHPLNRPRHRHHRRDQKGWSAATNTAMLRDVRSSPVPAGDREEGTGLGLDEASGAFGRPRRSLSFDRRRCDRAFACWPPGRHLPLVGSTGTGRRADLRWLPSHPRPPGGRQARWAGECLRTSAPPRRPGAGRARVALAVPGRPAGSTVIPPEITGGASDCARTFGVHRVSVFVGTGRGAAACDRRRGQRSRFAGAALRTVGSWAATWARTRARSSSCSGLGSALRSPGPPRSQRSD